VDDRELDEALEATFSASDPLANTVQTGIRGAFEVRPPVIDNEG
jgi:hypothetical protein